jgi:hypothetical protein
MQDRASVIEQKPLGEEQASRSTLYISVLGVSEIGPYLLKSLEANQRLVWSTLRDQAFLLGPVW